MSKLLKYFAAFFIIAFILGVPMAINAQEKCNLYYLPQSTPLTFDNLPHVSLNEFLDAEFRPLNVRRNVQYFAPLPSEILAQAELQADKKILSYSDDVQDIYWLYSIASLPDIKPFFARQDSDFAPYILKALKRQNMDKMANQFSAAMEVFGTRYQGFDETEKSIKSFSIPVRESELDEIFLQMFAAYDNSAEGRQYKNAALKQRELTKQMDGDTISYQRRNMMEYIQFYQRHTQTLAAQKLLDGFPSQDEIYQTIYERICNNPNLINWYLASYNGQINEDHLWFIEHKLITRGDELGPYESWPLYFQNIYSLYLFQIEIINGGINQYFENSSKEDFPNLLKALKLFNLNDIVDIVSEARSLHDHLAHLEEQYNLSSPQDYEKLLQLHLKFLNEFDMRVNIDEINSEIDRAVLKIAVDNRLISH